jgi:hypothetical protein
MYIFVVAAMAFDNCDSDPHTGHVLTSPIVDLDTDTNLTFYLHTLTASAQLMVYQTSVFGHIDSLLGTYSNYLYPISSTSTSSSSNGQPGYTTSTSVGGTASLCLPRGKYQLVFVASTSTIAEDLFVPELYLTNISLTSESCSFSGPDGNIG